MGLLQKAYETYECFQHIAGVYQANQQVLTPVGHNLTKAGIAITLDGEGNFLSASRVEKDAPKVIIPVTEASANRTSAPAAHPLCEQLGYLYPEAAERYRLYLEQLQDWRDSAFSHPQLEAVLRYVQGGSIVQDLLRSAVLPAGKAALEKEGKSLVVWSVLGLGEEDSGPCWRNRKLMQAFQGYYLARLQRQEVPQLCMITGETALLSDKHAKGIVANYGNAKLISSNDSVGFTYRGRFTDGWQAATVGYEASQKAHNALQWLIDNQKVAFGGRYYLCWNPQGHAVPHVTGAMGRKNATTAVTSSDYQQQLRQALAGWKTELPTQAGVVIAAFDAATSGRLALTYYAELPVSDFLQRLYQWEAICCWQYGDFGIQTPSLRGLVQRAFGTWRGSMWDVDDRILKQQMQRLVNCRISGGQFPVDVKKLLVQRASNLNLFPAKERTALLHYTCAAIRKYTWDITKEEISMSLDISNTDRSYLFGRLLAVAEAVEKATYQGGEERETNAMRMQQIFSQRPLYTWRILEERLNPYYARLSPSLRSYFKQIIAEIVDKLPLDDSSLNYRLADTYLIGYYHQRAYRKHKAAEDSDAE